MAIISETPSRIWRRIQDGEERDMPSLPSLPAFEDSAMVDADTSSHRDESSDNLSNISTPITSTPAPTNSHHTASTIYGHSATASATRFANSIRSSNRSSRSSLAGFMSSKSISRLPPQHESFDVSAIPSLPAPDVSDEELDESQDSVPNAYLPPQDTQHEDEYGDLSITDALRSVSRSGSPSFSARDYRDEATPKKKFSESYVEYSVSLRSEPKVRRRDIQRIHWTNRAQALALQEHIPSKATLAHANPLPFTHVLDRCLLAHAVYTTEPPLVA